MKKDKGINDNQVFPIMQLVIWDGMVLNGHHKKPKVKVSVKVK